ncbi:hypothetical protein AMTR_s00001p00249510 [Amborella trichopoda]|uniref:Uncharacterized protein n=1 Tax=Amborella trichopoda TaxID=13333 RepID=W1NMC7_AMBTC|nr:hypothetical protein AMTR_s00001p00249510 [Amborella trichopoda]
MEEVGERKTISSQGMVIPQIQFLLLLFARVTEIQDRLSKKLEPQSKCAPNFPEFSSESGLCFLLKLDEHRFKICSRPAVCGSLLRFLTAMAKYDNPKRKTRKRV